MLPDGFLNDKGKQLIRTEFMLFFFLHFFFLSFFLFFFFPPKQPNSAFSKFR